MDGLRFDRLTRAFLLQASRRGLLRLLGAGLAALPTLCETGDATAKVIRCDNGRCPQHRVCYRGQCREHAKWVGAKCEHHGPPCKYGSICTATGSKRGRCVCPSGLTRCDRKSCRDLRSDPFNCGGCGRACFSGATTCQNGSCCTVNGVGCPASCGAGAYCAGCCTGICRLDETCGPITDCLASGASCPAGCALRASCPGCCDGTCDAAGRCSAVGCVRYGGACTQAADCCDAVPCVGGLCRFN